MSLNVAKFIFHPSQSHFLLYKKISKSDIADEQKITAEDVRTGCLKLFVSPISCSLFDLRLGIKKTRNQNINLYIIFFIPLPSSSFICPCPFSLRTIVFSAFNGTWFYTSRPSNKRLRQNKLSYLYNPQS